jgi:hypothetical protein
VVIDNNHIWLLRHRDILTIKFTTLSIGKGGLKGANAWYKRMILTSAKGVGGIGQKEEKGEKESAVVSGQSVAVGSITGEGKRAKGRWGDGGEEKDVSSGQWQLVVLKAKARGRRKRSKQWSVISIKGKGKGKGEGRRGEGARG